MANEQKSYTVLNEFNDASGRQWKPGELYTGDPAAAGGNIQETDQYQQNQAQQQPQPGQTNQAGQRTNQQAGQTTQPNQSQPRR